MDLISTTSIYLLLLLLPGFVSMFVARALAYRPDSQVFDKVLSALVYTFLIHSIYALIFNGLTPWILRISEGSLTVTLQSKAGLLSFFAIAVSLGVAAGLLENKDWHMKFVRWAHLTSRTSRQSVWMDVFLDKKGSWVTVHLKDGHSVDGWPEYFSDTFTVGPAVFLKQAFWISEDRDPIGIPDPGILINGNEIHSIQFYTPTEE